MLLKKGDGICTKMILLPFTLEPHYEVFGKRINIQGLQSPVKNWRFILDEIFKQRSTKFCIKFWNTKTHIHFMQFFNNPIIYALVFVLMKLIKEIEELNKNTSVFLFQKYGENF